MGKTRAECSQNAYTSHASAFLSHWIQILANSSPKSDIKKKKKKKKKKTTLFFRILRSVGRGQHKHFFFWPYLNPLTLGKGYTPYLGYWLPLAVTKHTPSFGLSQEIFPRLKPKKYPLFPENMGTCMLHPYAFEFGGGGAHLVCSRHPWPGGSDWRDPPLAPGACAPDLDPGQGAAWWLHLSKLKKSIVLVNSEGKKRRKKSLIGFICLYSVLWILKVLWIILSETIIYIYIYFFFFGGGKNFTTGLVHSSL